MRPLIENQFNEKELEKLYGGSGSGHNCGVKWTSDEEQVDNVVF